MWPVNILKTIKIPWHSNVKWNRFLFKLLQCWDDATDSEGYCLHSWLCHVIRSLSLSSKHCRGETISSNVCLSAPPQTQIISLQSCWFWTFPETIYTVETKHSVLHGEILKKQSWWTDEMISQSSCFIGVSDTIQNRGSKSTLFSCSTISSSNNKEQLRSMFFSLFFL